MLRVRLLGGLALEADGRPLDAAREPPRARAARLARAAPRHAPAARAREALLARRARDQRPREPAHDAARAAPRARRRRDATSRSTASASGCATSWVDLPRARPREEVLDRAASRSPGIDRDWAIAARDEHRERVGGAARPARRRRRDEPLRWAREAVRHDPLSEDAARRLMRLLAAAGDRAAALAAYVRLEDGSSASCRSPPSRQTRRAAGRDPRGRGAAARHRDARRRSRPRSRRRGGPLAGRDAELAPLARRAPARSLLAGEPGIGKTRLLAEAGRLAHERGATVCYGRCYEEQVAPYEPFAEALGPGCSPRSVDGEDERWRLFEAVGARAGGRRVLLLDDLHWADAGSLRLLAHLLRRPARPLVLGAYRDSEISRAHPLAGDARGPAPRRPRRARRRCAGSTRPRSPSSSARHARPRRRAAPRDRRQPVLRRGDPAPPRRRPATEPPIPEGVKDVIGRRLSRLAPETGACSRRRRRGPRVRPRAAGGGAADVDVLAALEEAAAAQMVREERPRAATRSPTRSCARRSTTSSASPAACAPTARSPTRSSARRPARRARPPPARGRRGRRGGRRRRARRRARGDARARLRGGGRAVRARARRRARTASRRRAELLLALGDARLRAGESRARDAFAEAAALARDAGRAELLARAALGFSGLGVTIIAVDHEAVALLEEALPRSPTTTAARAARRAAGDRDLLRVDARAAQGARATRPCALARGRRRCIDALDARHAALWSAQYLDERLATAREMLELATARDAERELQARNWLVLDLMERGDIAAARGRDRRARGARRAAAAAGVHVVGPDVARDAGDPRRALRGRRGADRATRRATRPERAALRRDPGLRARLEPRSTSTSSTRRRSSARPAARPSTRTAPATRGCSRRRAAATRRASRSPGSRRRLRAPRRRHEPARRARRARPGDRVLGDPTHAAGVLERLAPYADRNIPNGRGAAGYGSAAHHLAVLEALLGRDAGRASRRRCGATRARQPALGRDARGVRRVPADAAGGSVASSRPEEERRWPRRRPGPSTTSSTASPSRPPRGAPTDVAQPGHRRGDRPGAGLDRRGRRPRRQGRPRARSTAGRTRRPASARWRCSGSPTRSRSTATSSPSSRPATPASRCRPSRTTRSAAMVDNLRFFAGAARNLEGKAGGRVPRGLHVVDPPRAGRRRSARSRPGTTR